ncbi:MAG TPA: spermidine/putrescine ABC transporter substrate-binding protein [Rugosimonospora sp.]|nr:spermidine/putrescine ABC transporter substrate-binding protein [Rugosimonospora sp.]
MTGRRLGRRDILRAGGLSATALALAACGVKGKAAAKSSPAPNAVEQYWSGKTKSGHVYFANWPLYMDPKKPELAKFTQQTGIQVTYQEVIQDDAEWFAKIQPQLAANRGIGYDLMVVTDGVQFGELVELGYLAPLDHTKLPNFAANAGAKYKHETFDDGNVYSIPWASGATGIAYNPDKVTTPPTKIADLWDPQYKGKVGMMSDTQEIGNFGMLALGIKPETSTKADWQQAAARLKQQRDAGIVRKYYDQGYIDDLGKGNITVCMAWSGDIFQKNLSDGTNLKFVVPEEGGSLWTDNMMIPITATNPVDAITLMDFFYDPKIAASIAEYINYITPVPSAQAIIKSDAAAATKPDDKTTLTTVASSPLVFPSEEDYAKLHYYRTFKTTAERNDYEAIFNPVVTS